MKRVDLRPLRGMKLNRPAIESSTLEMDFSLLIRQQSRQLKSHWHILLRFVPISTNLFSIALSLHIRSSAFDYH